jgi:hypothetical protein
VSGDETTDATPVAAPAPARPVLRIVRGDPSPEEAAALIAVLSAAGGGHAPPSVPAPPSRWARPSDLVRAPVHPGPGGWRASAFPTR